MKDISKQSSADQVRNTLALLKSLRSKFDKKSAARKLKALDRLRSIRVFDPKLLLDCHDLLAYMRAYPDNPKILSAVDRELVGFEDRVDLYKQETRDKDAHKLLNSGIAGTIVLHTFGFKALELLLKAHPDKFDIDWEQMEDGGDYDLTDLLQLLVSWHENDAIDNDDTVDSQAWLSIARGIWTRTDLGALHKLFVTSGLPRNAQEYLFEKLDFWMKWDLTGCPAARNLKRVPAKRIYYQKGPHIGRTPDLRRELKKKAVPLKSLTLREGREAVRAINEVLAVRYRELQPLSYANPAEVYSYEPGRGVQILVFGASPEIRLPLESNFGAMLVRNGLPIGYGVGATLFDRVEIAINMFPAFRSGESSYVIEQFFRLFYHHFGSRVFLVRSRQMGNGDWEPLKSGAFWFYYKLGFRAVKPRVRALAEEEHQLILADRKYRSPLKRLKRLAVSDVFFHADPSQMDDYEEFPIMNLGYVVTRYFAEKFDGDRRRGTSHAVHSVARTLKIRRLDQWSADERTALRRLAPLIINIPRLREWSSSDKRSLAQLIRSKGAFREREFVLRSNHHPRFKAALDKLSTSYEHPE
ncbi:MAG: hypothetical protein ABIK83_04375 [Candidatus Zixiibacteriota bacterium]